MTLSCLSIRVHPATFSQLGFAYRLEFSTADDASINHELARAGGTDEAASWAILNYPGSEALGPIVADLRLKTPMAGDLDVDGVTDFLQVDRPVANLTTSGTLEVDDGMDVSRGAVTATWSRAAGSASGTVQMRVSLPDFSIQDLVFNHAFEVFQYSGRIMYDVAGTNITATMDLPRVGGGEGFRGAFPLGRMDVVTLARLPASWEGPGAILYEPIDTFGLEGLETTVNYLGKGLYAGLVILADGDPSTPFADEYDFLDLVIRDGNDADADGIPDLSDIPREVMERPGVSLRVEGGRLWATVRGVAGARCWVERADALAGWSWAKAAEVTVGAAGWVEADLGVPTGGEGWFRARWP